MERIRFSFLFSQTAGGHIIDQSQKYFSLPYVLELFFVSLFDIIAKACLCTSWLHTFKRIISF